MKSTQIDAKRLKLHWFYAKWWYLTLIIGCVLGWSLVFSLTAPQLPPEQKLDVHLTGNTINLDSMIVLESEILNEFRDSHGLKQVNVMRYPYLENSQYFEALTNALAGQMGDIWLFPFDLYWTLADMGGFIPLDAYVDDGTLLCSDELREKYTFTTEFDRENPALYGVPADSMRYLKRHYYDTTGLVAAIPIYSKNSDTAIAALAWMQRYYDKDPGMIELKP